MTGWTNYFFGLNWPYLPASTRPSYRSYLSRLRLYCNLQRKSMAIESATTAPICLGFGTVRIFSNGQVDPLVCATGNAQTETTVRPPETTLAKD